MRNLLRNLGASAVGLGAALLLIELALIWIIPPPLKYIYPQAYFLVDHELGWLLKPHQHTFTVAWPVVTNSLGFRSPEIATIKKAGTLRCLCLGDSQTFGNAVEQVSTYPARLQEILRARSPRGAEVINAGIGGYDTVQEVALMERLAPALKPDVVVIGFYLNDIVESLRIDKDRMVDPSSGELRRHGIRRFTPYRLIYLLKRSRLVTLVYWRLRILMAENDLDSQSLLGKSSPALEMDWKVIEDVLRRARQDADSGGYRLIVFPVPTGQEFIADFPDEQYRSRLSALAERLGLEHFDPTPVMKAAGGGFETYFVTWDGHINARTHDIIAHLLAERIASAPAGEGAGSPAATPPLH